MINSDDIKLLEHNGWTITCEDPLEISNDNMGANASGVAAKILLEVLVERFKNKDSITFKEFKTNWELDILPNTPKHIKKGQSLMNYLSTVWMEEYRRLSSVHYYDSCDIDCFFNDDLIDNTLKHLKKVWKNYPD